MVGEAFATNLLRATAFTDGVDQLDAIGVDDAEHSRRGQEDLCPVLMRREEAKEPRPLGEPGGTASESRVSASESTPGCRRL